MARITPELLLTAYANGLFPMAPSRNSHELHWLDPDPRGILPIEGFHISRSLARRMRSGLFRVTVDQDFAGVMAGCADREETWINTEITELFTELHALGFAHSLELYEGEALVGGVYGVALGAAFFAESMFSRRTDASKAALACLLARLGAGGFRLIDTQFLTPHLASLGGVEIARSDYRRRLARALATEADFNADGAPRQPAEVAQRNSQTS